MKVRDLLADRQAIIDQYGVWGSANVALPFGLFTIDADTKGDNIRAYKFLQIISSILQKPYNSLRIADLACGEGLYSVEFAQHGADVLGIEGRVANMAKADFARRAWNLKNLKLVQDDVRNFNSERYGRFDVILCSGILYHLDDPDCFHLIERMRSACCGICILDTRISMRDDVIRRFRGKDYGGCFYDEHAETDTLEMRASRLGSSLDNVRSFWFSRRSLTNCLVDSGFSLVLDVMAPVPKNTRADRATLVACTASEIRPYNIIRPGLETLRWPVGNDGDSF